MKDHLVMLSFYFQENSSKNDASTQEMHVHLVKVNHCEAVGDVILQYDLADKTVKPTNIIIKAVGSLYSFKIKIKGEKLSSIWCCD